MNTDVTDIKSLAGETIQSTDKGVATSPPIDQGVENRMKEETMMLETQIRNLIDEHGHYFWFAAYGMAEDGLCECGRDPKYRAHDGTTWAVCNRCHTRWALEHPPEAKSADLAGYRTIEPFFPVRKSGVFHLVGREEAEAVVTFRWQEPGVEKEG